VLQIVVIYRQTGEMIKYPTEYTLWCKQSAGKWRWHARHRRFFRHAAQIVRVDSFPQLLHVETPVQGLKHSEVNMGTS